ncbi:site-specific DNA recombinase [Hyphomicrobium sp. 1Nfss2.1]|uniref:recombinase family protein n=1 Tax=Hyphomicrobium sp. 1Nfss2.1 TaxID=3413936 RepID=UPI003C7AE456
MSKPRAYSYLRFSTPEQQRGDSFRRQKELAEGYAAAEGLELDNRSFEDLGVSAFRGKNASSGMLRTFLEAVEEGAIAKGSYLLVESLDRLSRAAARKALHQLEEICDAGIVVITLTDGKRYDSEGLDKDPMALMFALVVMMRAHEESAMKSGRLKAAWKAKRSRAKEKPVTSRTPAWIRVGENGALELVGAHAAVVRRVFDMTLAGMGQHAIAATFNREGIPTFGKGRYWQRSYIAKVLGNPATVGTFVPHTVEYVDGKRRRRPAEVVEGYFPAVVSKADFERVQALSRGAPATRSSSALRNLFGGLARCPKCHSTMTRVSKGSGPKGGKPYLVCVVAKQGGKCVYRAVPLEPLEQAFLGGVSDLIREIPSERTVAASDAHAIERMLADVDAQINKINPKDTLKLASFASIRESLRVQHAAEIERVSAAHGQSIVSRARELSKVCKESTVDRQRANAILRQMCEGIFVEYDMNLLAFRWHHGGETAVLWGA